MKRANLSMIFIVNIIFILITHFSIMNFLLNFNFFEKFQNNEYDDYNENNEINDKSNLDTQMENELKQFINNNNICNSEIKISNDNIIYKLDDNIEKIKPYNSLSRSNKSKFCSDEDTGLKYYNKNKSVFNKFLNKFMKKKCNIKPNIDSQTYQSFYKENDNTISKETIKYNNEKLLNGGEFYNGIKGFSDYDLNDNYATYDSI